MFNIFPDIVPHSSRFSVNKIEIHSNRKQLLVNQNSANFIMACQYGHLQKLFKTSCALFIYLDKKRVTIMVLFLYIFK